MLLCARIMKALFLFEFPSSQQEWLMPTLIDALELEIPSLESDYFHGFLKTYNSTGLTLPRLVNMAYIYLMLPIKLLLSRPDVTLVRTTPPCIQLYMVFWCWILRIPSICWLMDYHPEIEARYLERKPYLKPLSKLLRKTDAWLLNKFKVIIALDPAIAQLCKERAPEIPVIIHPTWSQNPEEAAPVAKDTYKPSIQRLNLAYAGNLGKAHAIDALERILKKLSKEVRVELNVINCPQEAQSQFKAITQKTNTALQFYPRQTKEGLQNLMQDLNIDFGIVLMKSIYAGLVSPSKFTGYLLTGVPILYLGPEHTNADSVCRDFKAGLSIKPDAAEEAVNAFCEKCLSPEERLTLRSQVTPTANHFASLGPDILAKKLVPYFLKK